MAHRPPIINVMSAAALKAARGLQRDYGEVDNLQVSRKGPADFVSAADRRAEKLLRTALERARPGFGFLMEESGAAEGTVPGARWIVDPLDGTTNFLHGIPHFSISIAYQQDLEIVAGVVYDPLRDEMFWAEKGAGAHVNDRRLRVSARKRIEDAVVATGIPHLGRPGHDRFQDQLSAVMERVAGVRRMGSAALDLAYVAAGRYDAFWESGLSQWDLAAGLILVREAGGLISDLEGGENILESGGVIAANADLFDSFAALIREAG